MRNIMKALIASLVIFLALESASYASVAGEAKVTTKIIGTSVNLSEQNVVWHQGNNYVIEIKDKDYLVKADDDGHAIVVDRIHNLAAFVANPNPVIARTPAPVFWYNPYSAPVIVGGFSTIHFFHPHRIYYPVKVYRR